jgi:hypothetical protein
MWWVVAVIVTVLIFGYAWLSGGESAGSAAYEGALLLGILALSRLVVAPRIKVWVDRRRSPRA